MRIFPVFTSATIQLLIAWNYSLAVCLKKRDFEKVETKKNETKDEKSEDTLPILVHKMSEFWHLLRKTSPMPNIIADMHIRQINSVI